MNFATLLIVLPQIVPFNFGEEQIYLEESATATCAVSKGDLPIHIWWSLSDDYNTAERNISTNDGIVISKNGNKLSVLNMEIVKARHRGNYTCYARNKAGITQHTAYLSINGETNIFFLLISFCTFKLLNEFCNTV